jgi:hypothetical protein
MPLYEQFHTLFLHIPRTGGSTIESLGWEKSSLKSPLLLTKWKDFYVSQLQPIPLSQQHYGWNDIVTHFSPLVPSIKLIFTIVRHPYDRLVSEYFYLKNVILDPTHPKRYLDHVKRYNFNMEDCLFLVDFDTFVQWAWENYAKNLYFMDGHFRLQTDLLPGENDVKLLHEKGIGCMQFRFEEYPKILDFMISEFQLSPKKEIKKKSHDSVTYSKTNKISMTPTTFETIQRWYAKDCELLGYDPYQTIFPDVIMDVMDNVMDVTTPCIKK